MGKPKHLVENAPHPGQGGRSANFSAAVQQFANMAGAENRHMPVALADHRHGRLAAMADHQPAIQSEKEAVPQLLPPRRLIPLVAAKAVT